MTHAPPMNSHLFEGLNQQFFDGRLPRYQVIVAPHLVNSVGRIARKSRRIYIAPADAVEMVKTLLHEMAHAATNDSHGSKWRAEMERLRIMGAPIEDLAYFDARARLTRQLVFAVGVEIFFAQPEVTILQVARWIHREYGFADSAPALLRGYPWIRRVLHDARRVVAEDHHRRERIKSAHA